MYKKLFLSLTLVLALIFSFTYTFAANEVKDAVEGVRNVVGGAENAVEDAAKDISNTTKNITGGIENGTQRATNDVKDNMENDRNSMMTGSTDNQQGYTATRTATTNTGSFLGMNSTVWTWLILGIAAVAIIALVWYYSMRLTTNNYDDRNND